MGFNKSVLKFGWFRYSYAKFRFHVGLKCEKWVAILPSKSMNKNSHLFFLSNSYISIKRIRRVVLVFFLQVEAHLHVDLVVLQELHLTQDWCCHLYLLLLVIHTRNIPTVNNEQFGCAQVHGWKIFLIQGVPKKITTLCLPNISGTKEQNYKPFSPTENWNQCANFEYRTIFVRFKGAEILTKQNWILDKGNCNNLLFSYLNSEVFWKMIKINMN